MSAHSRRKGSRYELDVHKHLEATVGDRWQRINRNGFDGADGLLESEDRGLELSVECKNHKTMALAAWVDQAIEQAEGRPAVVIHKRAGRSDVAEHYASMTVADLLRILED